MDRFTGSNDDHVNDPCSLCGAPSEAVWCQVCKKDVCPDCMIDHIHPALAARGERS